MAYDPNDPNATGETPTLPQTPSLPAQAAAAPVTQPTADAQTPAPPMPAPSAGDLKQLDVMRNPYTLSKIASAFLDAGDSTGLQWLQHVHTALRENAVDAIGALRAGNGPLAVSLFNQS